MQKIKLVPESLAVESFETRDTREAGRGTVYGHVTPGFDCMWTGIKYPTCDTCPNPTIEEPGCA